jgi:hypothetical protein
MKEQATAFESAELRPAARQFELNRRAVTAADDAHLRGLVHPNRWERRGVLRILRRRSQLSRVW